MIRRGIDISQLSKDVVALIPAEERKKNGIRERKPREKVVNSIPDSWGQCRPHGVAWFPKRWPCIFCEAP